MTAVHRAIMVRSYGYSHWETVGSKSRGDQILVRCRQWSNLVMSELIGSIELLISNEFLIGVYIPLNVFQTFDVK